MKNSVNFSRLLFLLSFLSFSVIIPVSGQVVFNEMMSNNQNTVTDSDGDFSDWIELYNTTAAIVNLNGYSLSDNPDSLNKWTFPNYNLAPGGFLRIWCSDKNRLTTPFHTNFSIESRGEAIYLTDATGTVIDYYGPTYLPADISFGRLPNGTATIVYLSVATPALSNNAAQPFSGAIQDRPVFSIPGGFYTDSIYVSLSHPDPSVVIRYTTDGSEPTTQSPIYSSPLLVKSRIGEPNNYSMIRTCYNVHFWLPDWRPPLGEVFKSTPLRARAFKTGYLPGPVKTETYFVDPSMNTRYGQLPVVSVVSDPKNLFNDTTGIYVPGITYVPGTFNANYYEDWKRPANIEMYLPGGQQAFNSNFRIAINGVSSRSSPQKGLNVNASSDYGASKINYPVFENNSGKAKYIQEFDKLKLRAWGSDRAYALFRDAYAASFLPKTELDYEAYRPCVVFIDGEYWGLQEIRERVKNASYYQEHYLIDSPVDIVDLQTGEPLEGDTVEWNALRRFILNNNMADTTNFNYVKSKIDINSFLLHYLFSIYFSRGDWPDQNECVWRTQDGTRKWKWILWDMDNTVAYYLNPWYDMFNQAIVGNRGYGPSDILVSFLANDQFRYDFINSYCDWMNTSFLPTLMQQRVDSMKAELSPFISEYQSRWQVNYNWTNQTDSMKWWVGLRPQFCRQHLQSRFSLNASVRLGLQVSDTLKGNIQVNTVQLNGETPRTSNFTFPWAGYYFPGVPVPISAIPKPGYRFLHWLPTFDTSATITANLTRDTLLTAVFDIDPNYSSPPRVVINEVMTSNTFTIPDNYGEYDDWLELYNPNPDTVDVAGWYLTDNLILPTRYQFPSGSDSTKIPPYGYKLVWADDDTEQGGLHTNFKFNASGDLLVLYRPDGETVVDSISIPALATDLSYGRGYDASPDWITFLNTTPDSTNREVVPDNVIINEVMSFNTSVVADNYGDYDAWVEVYNPSTDTVDLSGWFISNQLNQLQRYRLPYDNDSLLLAPYSYKLLWVDNQTEQGALHLPFTFNNNGDCFVISRPNGELNDSVCFGTVATNISYGRSYDGSPQWIDFVASTPNATNVEIPAGNLLINELLSVNINSVVDDQGEHEPWIEIYNPGQDTIDLAGWYLSDDLNQRTKFRFDFGSQLTSVAPGEHLLLWSDGQPQQGPLHLSFRLSAVGGCLYLNKPDGVTLSDSRCYGALTADISNGRAYDASPNWIDFPVPTPGAYNWLYTSEIVFINEVQAFNSTTIADNYGEFDPWIELYNPNADTLDLQGWYISDDLLAPDKFRFSAGNDSLKIAPYGFILLWADNEATQGDLHVGFRLTNSPTCIQLSRPDVSFVDSVCYPVTAADESYGRIQDGFPVWLAYSIPTPDSNNVDLTIGITNLSPSSLKAYPNPANGGTVLFSRSISFTLYDVRGKLIATEYNRNSFDVSGLQSGMYLLRANDGASLRLIIE